MTSNTTKVRPRAVIRAVVRELQMLAAMQSAAPGLKVTYFKLPRLQLSGM